MKIIMSIDQYKQYKSGELSLLDIKLENIGINKITTYENGKLILTLVLFLGGIIASDIILGSLAVNAFEYKPESCVNLFSVIDEGIGSI
jgi:hypothetical protein